MRSKKKIKPTDGQKWVVESCTCKKKKQTENTKIKNNNNDEKSKKV